VFERFRGILHEGSIDKRVQYIIEGLFAVRKNGWADYPTVLPELDLVELDDQITHELSLDENHDIQTGLSMLMCKELAPVVCELAARVALLYSVCVCV